MAHLTRRHPPGRQLLDLTPLIDIALILVVFMLLNNERSDLQQLPVVLPATTSGQETTDLTLVDVVIDAEGRMRINGDDVTLEQLASHIDQTSQVSVLADRDCRHGLVVEVVDRLREAGATAVYYASEERDEEW